MTENMKMIVEPLLVWFRSHARVLPWRDEPTPYRVWVSEIMLQQTRVEAVKPYYQRFMAALPTVEALAGCSEEELLKLWEGLGYYNRVRNMQTAARTVMEEYGGVIPSDYQALLSLKGIGEYTAGAISSIAYNLPVPAVDGNVLRVISRITLNTEDILKPSVKKKIAESIKKILPIQNAGEFNQALMELGACVCVPNGTPHCSDCPLSQCCMAHLEDKTSEIPYKAPNKKRRIEEKTILIIREEDQVALNKRPDQGLLAGMYELPNLNGHKDKEEVLEFLQGKKFLPVHIQELPPSKHIFSHVEWHMNAYMILVQRTDHRTDYVFVDRKQIEEKYPIPAAFEAYTRFVQIRLGQDRYKEEM